MQSGNNQQRRSIFSGLALVTAMVAATASIVMYLGGLDTGFEGFGLMLLGSIVGGLGAIIVLACAWVARLRREKPGWVAVLAIVVCVANLLWLFGSG